MDTQKRVSALTELGLFLAEMIANDLRILNSLSPAKKAFIETCNSVADFNPWYTHSHVVYAIQSIAGMLQAEKIHTWLEPYFNDFNKKPPAKVVAVMAGNIPLVGFHDFLCILITGNCFIGKLSSQDNKLLPALGEVLIEIEPGFKDDIKFTEEVVSGFDAIIATGSNNTSRYFEYYFGKYPNIIRKNRNGVAVLTGNETEADLEELGKDIFLYFGLGCRNVSKLCIPKGFSLKKVFPRFEKYSYVVENHKYRNNYDYFKSIFLVNNDSFEDNGFALFKKEKQLSSPVSVLYFKEYDTVEKLNMNLQSERDNIQCVVSKAKEIENAIPPGTSQSPELWDYADNINTIEFLLDLKNND